MFVSSTFTDMQAERDELILRVFPVLRELCELRGARWEEVDLRWGVTAEQIAAGDLLRICFAEIDEAWPFFIGLLGHRYGSGVDTIPYDVLAEHPWLSEYPSSSVTELEIRRALRVSEEGTRRFFYFRTLAAPPQTGSDATRLQKLKNDLAASGEPIRRYANVSELGAVVLNDLATHIERLLPMTGFDDGVEEENFGQLAFAASVGSSHVERQGLSAQLDQHLRTGKLPIVVTGIAGSGKSASLAHWSTRMRTAAPPASIANRFLRFLRPARRPFVLAHFVEATARSGSWTALAQRVVHAVQKRYGIALPRAVNVDELRTAFVTALHAIAADETLILVVDGLDHLSDDGDAPLGWLPESFPSNVRVVVSCGPGTVREELQRRRWPIVEMEQLTVPERTAIVQRRLDRTRRTLAVPAVQKIVGAPVSTWPGGVDAIVEELRVFGEHFGLDSLIAHITAKTTVDELYDDVLQRFEHAYAGDMPRLVPLVLSLLAISPHGLSSREILDTIERTEGRRPLPIRWSQLRLALDPFLMRTGGLLRIGREAFKDAVRRRYPQMEEMRRALIVTLSSASPAARRHDAILAQLITMRDWLQARSVLADADTVDRLWRIDPSTVVAAWRSIERHAQTSAAATYREGPPSAAIVELLLALGHSDAAAVVSERLVSERRQEGDIPALQQALSRLAAGHDANRRLKEAGEVLKEEEALCRRLGDRAALAACLGNQGVVWLQQDQLDAAEACFEKEKTVCADMRDDRALAASAEHHTMIALRRNLPKEALRLAREHERLARRAGDLGAIAASHGNHALALAALGKITPAIYLQRREEALLRELHDDRKLQRALGNLALLLMRKADYDAARTLLDERAAICERLRIGDGAADTALQRAFLYGDCLGVWTHARPFAEEALRLGEQFDVPRVAEAARRLLSARP